MNNIIFNEVTLALFCFFSSVTDKIVTFICSRQFEKPICPDQTWTSN